MRIENVLWVLGLMLRPFAALLLLPALVDFLDGDSLSGITFVATGVLAFLVGSLLARMRGDTATIGRVEAMATVASAWLVAALFGSIPYIQQDLGVVDALFESMSGFTTTGSTIFLAEHWERLSRGLFFWRAMTQWLGGMGIIVLFVAILPALAVAGRQMFFTEAPGPEEETLTPRIRHTAAALWKLYIGLTALETVLLTFFGGMSFYDAICHAMTTLAAGGFSPNPQSLAGYGAAAQWIVIPFMFLAGTSFALQYRALFRPKALGRDTEFKVYALLTLGIAVSIAILLSWHHGHGPEEALRHGLFQTASMLTTTGYASEDFNLWEPAAQMMLGILMFVGGCAGSAGGGPKVVRIVVLFKFLGREVLKALHPRAVRVVRVADRPLQVETTRQITGFLVAYLCIFGIVAAAVAIIENDMTVGLTGSIVTLGNIGPGYGAIGPMETFGNLATGTKLILFFNMWIGRLEVMTVLILFHPDLLRTLLRQTLLRRRLHRTKLS
jgi:trk system potassium uptake protein TrkH